MSSYPLERRDTVHYTEETVTDDEGVPQFVDRIYHPDPRRHPLAPFWLRLASPVRPDPFAPRCCQCGVDVHGGWRQVFPLSVADRPGPVDRNRFDFCDACFDALRERPLLVACDCDEEELCSYPDNG